MGEMDRGSCPSWHGGTRASTYTSDYVSVRAKLADASKQADWDTVIRLVATKQCDVNVWRLDEPSWYTPLHQAAYVGAPRSVIRELLDLGAWRALQTSCGERALDIADRRRHKGLLALLTPILRHRIAPGVLLRIHSAFHEVIRGRVADLVAEHELRLPELEPLLELETPQCWFPVPGMYGGFHYWFELHGKHPALIAESWCRVAGGSGQRHEITCRGSRLVDEGFM